MRQVLRDSDGIVAGGAQPFELRAKLIRAHVVLGVARPIRDLANLMVVEGRDVKRQRGGGASLGGGAECFIGRPTDYIKVESFEMYDLDP